jgi:hypothetical protein
MDLLPIILVVGFFQIVVIRQPIPDFLGILTGMLLVVLGLMLFVEGLELGLFPIGETMSYALARKGSLSLLLFFSFTLGFSTSVAEPALIAVCKEAAKVYSELGFISGDSNSVSNFALGLRLSIAVSVGIAIIIGVLRILRGWPLYFIIIPGYVLVMLMTIIAPYEIIGIAYDAGGVTTSTITVPLITALGVGLASVIQGRNPLTDGFGMIAIAALFPIIAVLLYGIFYF